MKPFLIRWIVTTFAVAVATNLPGIHAEGWAPLVCMALFLGIINAFVRPVLLLLSLPFIVVTLGFFILIVNTLTFWLAGGLVPGFHVDGFWNAFFGSIVVSIVSWALSGFVRRPDGHFRVLSQQDRFTSADFPAPAGPVTKTRRDVSRRRRSPASNERRWMTDRPPIVVLIPFSTTEESSSNLATPVGNPFALLWRSRML